MPWRRPPWPAPLERLLAAAARPGAAPGPARCCSWGVAAAAALAGWLAGPACSTAACAWGFAWFNRGFRASIAMYLRCSPPAVALSGAGPGRLRRCSGVTWWGFRQMPMGFIPSQDMGYLLVNVQLPDSASLERTTRRHRPRGEDHPARPHNGVKHTVGVVGHVVPAERPRLEPRLDVRDPRRLRRPPRSRAVQRADRRRAAEAACRGGPRGHGHGLPRRRRCGAWAAPADSRSWSRTAATCWAPPSSRRPATDWCWQATARGPRRGKLPLLVGLFNTFRANIPSYFFDLNRSQCKAMQRARGRRQQRPAGLPRLAVRQRFQPLRADLAGRSCRPRAASATRSTRSAQMKVRNVQGGMVPLGAVAHMQADQQPADPHPLQHLPGGRHQRQRRSADQLRRRHQAHGATGRPGTAPLDGLRMDGDGVPGVAWRATRPCTSSASPS